MGRSVSRRRRRLPGSPLAFALPIALAAPWHTALAQTGPALPTGGAVVGGAAQILAPDAGQLLIRQETARAVIDWQSFSVGERGHVRFENGSGATLNRVLGGDPSRIAGLLSATGSVWLVNPAGVLVSPEGRVTTGGSFVASTRSIAPAAFLEGGALLEGDSAAAVANEGRLEAGGDVVLIGRLVENRGSVKAAGEARLVSADRILLKDAGADGRVHVEVTSDATGSGEVRNSGRIEAAAAELRAVGGNVYALAADTGGVIRATGVRHQGGRILLVGDAGVTIGGTLDASGTAGGSVDVTGGRVLVGGGAHIAARGTTGDGGSIRIGGARQGGPGLAAADTLDVAQGSRIDAGSDAGRGGTVILWSEQRTRFDGLVRADGAAGGGFVETSSRDDLGVGHSAQVEVGNGEWLIDPRNVVIDTGGADPVAGVNDPPSTGTGAYQINRLTLINVLNAGGNVTITTTQSAFSDAGNITVNGAIGWTGPNSLTLRADNDIAINAAVGSSGGGSLALVAGTTNPGGSITTAASLGATGGGSITLTAPGSITIGGPVDLSGTATLSATAGTDIIVNGAISAATGSSGSVLLDAGNALRLNAGLGLQGSASFRGIGRGTGIGFEGSGDLAFTTGTGALTLEAPGASGDIVVGRTADVSGTVRIATGGGALTLTAGRDIRLLSSPFAGGRWTRVGDLSTNAPITLGAGRDITWQVGNFSDSYVEVVTGGALSVTAGAAINLQPSTLGAARLQGRGSSFTLTAPTAVLNGTVEARGDTLLQGGAFSFGTTSPLFTLDPNRNFTLAAGSTITASSALSISTLGTGDIAFGGAVTGTILQALSDDEIRIGGPIGMSGSGNAILLSAGVRLVNLAGMSLSAPNGRWLTYSVSPFDDIGWQELNPDAPNLYGRSLGFLPPVSSPGTGNRRIYSFVPVLSLTGDSPTKTYGQAGPALGFSVSGLVPGDSLSVALVGGTATVTSSGTAATTPVGTYPTVVSARATAQGYQLNLVSGTLTVDPAPLVVTANAQTRQYGLADPALTFTASGFVNGETVSVLTGAPVRAPGENAGVYPIGKGTLAAANYSISFAGADFTITRAPLGVVAGPVTREYGLADPALSFTASGFRLGDTAATALTGVLARAPGEAVGVYGIGQGTLAAQNYDISFTAADFTITPAPLRITPANVSVNASDLPPDPVLAFTASGFRLGDTPATALTGALTRVGAGTNTPGDYAILPGTLASTGNYVLSFDSAIFSVTQLALTVIALDQRRLYGAPDPVFTFSVTGFAPGDDESLLTGSLARAPGEAVGSYAITIGTLAAPGYTIAFTPGTLVIDPAPLAVTALPAGKLYGATDPLLGFTASGFRLGDTIASLSGSLVRDAGETVGTYAIRQGTLSNPNYAIEFTGAAFRIDPATLRVVAAPATKIYGDADPELPFTASGFQFADTAGSVLTGALARTPGETVAGSPYVIGLGTLSAGPNYRIAFEGAPFTISRRLLTLVLTGSVSRTYDATLVAAIGSANLQLGGVLPGDQVSATAGSGSFDTPDVGTGKLVTANGVTLAGAAAGNYAVAPTASAAIGIITPAPLVATALDARRPFGVPNPPLGLSVTGLLGADTIQSIGLAAVTDATQGSPPGGYAIRVEGNPRNYSVTRIQGLLSVLPVPGFAQFIPELIEVPALGGYVQTGVGTGVTAIADTLVAVRPIQPEAVVRTSRFTVWLQPVPPIGDNPAGASGFERSPRSP